MITTKEAPDSFLCCPKCRSQKVTQQSQYRALLAAIFDAMTLSETDTDRKMSCTQCGHLWECKK